jgi:hypothetical protein
MSLHPPAERPTPDARLDPYRDRGGILRDDDGQTGTVYVRIETSWRIAAGRLWWRRWSTPEEEPWIWMLLPDGEFADFVLPSDQVEYLVEDWAKGPAWSI